MQHENFKIWDKFQGELLEDFDGKYRTKIFGFKADRGDRTVKNFHIQDDGACFGFVTVGRIYIQTVNFTGFVHAGQFFATAKGVEITFFPEMPFAVVINQAVGFTGQNYIGGPLESLGRLRYIDTCSDTLIIAPPLKGDPCFNHLHFPKNVDQTMHYHPSIRSGCIASGRGVCVTPYGEYPLIPGRIFSIPKDCQHKFRTENETMDVIAFHPDSDWGPEHETHPMINRTWVDGGKMDNSSGVHATGKFIQGRS